MSSSSSACTGSRLMPCSIARSSAAGDGGVVGDDDHVRPRHHHLAGDGVAELDDALDQLALLVLDHLVLGRGLDDAEQLLLADERALLEALAGQDHVGQPDQRLARSTRSGRKPHQPAASAGPSRRAARSGCRTAQVLGTASANTKKTTTLSTTPMTDTPRRRTGGRQDRDQDRLPDLQTLTVTAAG